MRALASVALLLLMFAPTRAADETAVGVELYRPDAKELTSQAREKVIDWTENFLKSANFNTANQPDILKQSVATIQEHYRKTARGDYLVVSYPHPMTFNTAGGTVTAVQIVVGLNRSDPYASALFTIDPDGRVIAHEKYFAALPPELAPAATTQSAR